MAEVGLQPWLQRLASGKVVVGHVRSFEEPVRKFFESAGVKSAMAVPVFADGRLWGHVGLDDCRDEREWSPAEIDTLKTLAELIGATVSARRHEAILETVAMSAKELLRSSDLQQSLPSVMERLGQATGVDRVQIIEIDTDTPSEHSPVVKHYVWGAPGVSSPINYQEIKEPMAEVGLKSWVPRLTRGETVVGNTRDFEPAARTMLERGNVKSVMAVPVFVDGQWWGLVAFDECGFERHWEPAEIDTFKALAELVGAAVTRARNLETLSDANRIVENSATALYRLYPQAPFPLTFLSRNFKRFGYEPEKLLTSATDWRQLVNKEDMPAVAVNLKSLAEGKVDSIRSEFRFKKPDGSWIWFANDARAIHAEGRLIAIEGVITDITERKSAAQRRDVILEAVAASAKELLRASDLQQSLPTVIQRIGQATGVDRAHIFEVDTSTPAGRVLEHYLWSAPGVPTSPLLAAVKGAAMAEVGFGPWLPRLAKGETIVGHVRDFEKPVRDLFSQLGTQSVLTVPVRVDGHWWGHLGFDDCRTDREWSPTEVDTLETLAELVGAAVARTSHLKTLADANRIVENSATILFRLDLKPPFPLIFVSQNMSRYGYQADELLAHPERWTQLIDPADLPAIVDDIRSISAGKMDSHEREFRARKPDGSIVWFDGNSRALRDGENRLVAVEGILTDITDRKLAAEQIATLARTDSLTGLPNRPAFLERLNLEFARAKRGANQFAVHYLDLDHFKDVNDTLGHPIGDALLRAVAERLRSCVRETDMVARFGGDEFAVLQDDIEDTANVETLAAKIGEILAAPFAIEGYQVETTASIGIVPYRDDVATVDVMMMKADLALYRAKNEGRNQFRFHVAELDEQTQERMIIGEELRHAIESGEFELYYQPQVEVKSGSMVGVEALIRWNHPKRGLMLPAAFIAIAETTGNIVSIGEWVIEHACRQLKAWSDLAIAPPTVAVNLSGAQFKLASRLDQIVTENLTRYNVAPEQLELELTESVLIETTQRHGETFKRLRKIGVRLAIDDFGTGYSSLDYLRSFRVSRLKIDRRFIKDVTTSADDAAIVRATIGLAHELGIEVIAEGVETAGQRDFLISAGCKLAQGYYFGKPMPTAATTELLRRSFQFATV
jgi:diguanylate cyclase (GGDEF)-like protein/PAS domain S-box-containing protein